MTLRLRLWLLVMGVMVVMVAIVLELGDLGDGVELNVDLMSQRLFGVGSMMDGDGCWLQDLCLVYG